MSDTLHDKDAALETHIMDDFIRARGQDPAAIRSRTDVEAKRLKCQASQHASGRLTEVRSRSQLVNDLHGK